MKTLYDVIVLGAGPAGLSAGLNGARLSQNVLLIERGQIGGHIINMEAVGDYPGFPEGISGAELGMKMYEQASNSGMKSSFGEVTELKVTSEECSVTAFGETHMAKVVIICTGLSPIKLGASNEDGFLGKGVSYCAVCDGPLYKEQDVAVVGNGLMAVEDAIHLSRFAQSVTLIYKENEIRASKALLGQMSAKKNIKHLCQSIVESVIGEENVTALKIKSTTTGENCEIHMNGVFISLGLTPNTEFLYNLLPLTETKHLVADDFLRVRYPNIYAAGDVRSGSLQLTAAQVGDGARAAVMAQEYLLKR